MLASDWRCWRFDYLSEVGVVEDMGNVKDEEEKKMDPLFPRLHVSDAEDKGGPRPPPRNKMALSEQLSLPRQRFTTPGSLPSILSLPTNNPNNLLPATSSYHDASYKKSMFSPFGSSSGSTRLAARLDSYHSGGMNLNISLTTAKQTVETTNCQTLCNAGHTKPADYCLFKPQSFADTRTPPVKKVDDEDDYLVPDLPPGSGKGEHNKNRGKLTSLSTNSHLKLPFAHKRQLKPTSRDATQESKLNTDTTNDIAKEPKSYQSAKFWMSEPEFAPLNPKKRSSLDEPSMLQASTARLQQKHSILQENMACRLLVEPENPTRKRSASTWPLLGSDHKTDGSGDSNRNEDLDCGSLQLGDAGKTKDVSEVNSVLGSHASPEEFAQLIGPQLYWKLRTTIVQQQKVFAFQVFELHRLIKVQKLIARSPDLLFEGLCRLKKMPSENSFPKVASRKTNTLLSYPVHNTIRKPLNANNDVDRKFTSRANCNPSSEIHPPPSAASDSKQAPQCFLPPPGNQWLVPVRSPSEGLVYKPYTGPCPPPAGLVAPIYGMSVTPSNGDLLSGAYGIPTSYQRGISIFPGTPLFQTYGLPMIKPSCSPLKEENINFALPIKTSCHILDLDDQPIPGGAQNLQGNRESDLQGSSGSSSSERKKAGDELPLFPTAPIVRDLDQKTEDKSSDQGIKVIKVVPHNPRLATQSAARIFQSIQEERKQYD